MNLAGDCETKPVPVEMDQIEAQLETHSFLRLHFSPALEDYYNAETKTGRIWNIRLTFAIGLFAYDVMTLTDSAVLPDLDWIPYAWRNGVVTPVVLLSMWACGKLRADVREIGLTVVMLGAMLGPVLFMWISNAPNAMHTIAVILMTCMFGNVTIRLRFQWAIVFSFVSLGWTGIMLLSKPHVPPVLSLHFLLSLIVCAVFGLVANNQLERSERRSFLISLRERKRSEELSADKVTLATLSQLDALTGLANRRGFDAGLAELWRKRDEDGQMFSLLMIDVDFFKRYNDRYGHPRGDKCLTQVAAIVRSAISRHGDLAARYGGEEFAVLLAGCGTDDAVKIANKIVNAIRDAAIAHDNRDDDIRIVTVSIGLASSSAGTFENVAVFLNVADTHLYEAKRNGRNQVCIQKPVYQFRVA